jgi:hypothetical protein
VSVRCHTISLAPNDQLNKMLKADLYGGLAQKVDLVDGFFALAPEEHDVYSPGPLNVARAPSERNVHC